MGTLKIILLIIPVLILQGCYDLTLIETGRTLGKKNTSVEASGYFYTDNRYAGEGGQGPAPFAAELKLKHGISNSTDLFLKGGLLSIEGGYKKNLFKSQYKYFSVATSGAIGFYPLMVELPTYCYFSQGFFISRTFHNSTFLTGGIKPEIGFYGENFSSHTSFGLGGGLNIKKNGRKNEMGSVHAEICWGSVNFDNNSSDKSFYNPDLMAYRFNYPIFSITLKLFVIRDKKNFPEWYNNKSQGKRMNMPDSLNNPYLNINAFPELK